MIALWAWQSAFRSATSLHTLPALRPPQAVIEVPEMVLETISPEIEVARSPQLRTPPPPSRSGRQLPPRHASGHHQKRKVALVVLDVSD